MAKLNPLKIFSPVSRLFDKGKSPHTEALPYLNAIPQFGREAYNPFIEQGRAVSGMLPDYARFANRPTDYLNQLMGEYQPSTGYQHKFGEANKQAAAAAGAGGYLGTESDQQRRAELVNSLMGTDMQQYLNNVLGIQEFGAKGLEGMVERGYQAGGNLADYLSGAYGQLGQSAGSSRAQSAANKQAFLNALMQAAASGAGAYYGAGMGGGGAGPAAAGVGAGINPGGRYMNPPNRFAPLTSINTSFYRNASPGNFLGSPGYQYGGGR